MLDDRDAIAGVTFDGLRAHIPAHVFRIGRAAHRLIPLHDGEGLLPPREQWSGSALGSARPAVQEQQDRVARVAPADRDPLLHAVDGREIALLDWRSQACLGHDQHTQDYYQNPTYSVHHRRCSSVYAPFPLSCRGRRIWIIDGTVLDPALRSDSFHG